MQYRLLGRTGYKVSAISFGAWAIGGAWGTVDDSESLKALHTAIDEGVNFIDTADVYGDGHSERLIAQILKDRSEEIIVATKAGRRLNPHVADGYTAGNLTAFIERSLKNLGVEALDIVQLHSPPTEVYYRPETFAALDDLKKAGKIKHYGVSVEKVEEALKAIDYPGVETVQIIFNMFRLRASELFFEQAMKRQIGILARVPLSSGMLTGKMNKRTQFAQDDHRNFNRHGESFDVGETFSGVDFDTGLKAIEELRALKPDDMTMAQFALRWILMFDAVTCAIPGAKTPKQAEDNARAGDFPDLCAETMQRIQEIYDQYIRKQVHHRW
ncbi:MAG: aldo/keto reductase [Anaerolineae bacterium]|nr:aldo/keto reductase [Anaerolineae bacterium]